MPAKNAAPSHIMMVDSGGSTTPRPIATAEIGNLPREIRRADSKMMAMVAPAAIAQAAPDLAKDTLEKIYDTVETRTREAFEKAGKKKAAKTPLKPFPFGEKK